MQICVYVYTIHKSNAFCSFWIMFSIYKIYFYYYKNILLKLDIFYMYIQIRILLCSLFWLIQFKKFLIKSLRFTQAQFPFYYQSAVIFLMWRSFSPTAIHALLLFALLAALALSFLSTSAALLRCSLCSGRGLHRRGSSLCPLTQSRVAAVRRSTSFSALVAKIVKKLCRGKGKLLNK